MTGSPCAMTGSASAVNLSPVMVSPAEGISSLGIELMTAWVTVRSSMDVLIMTHYFIFSFTFSKNDSQRLFDL